jgi:hypothetical protein
VRRLAERARGAEPAASAPNSGAGRTRKSLLVRFDFFASDS